MKAKWDSEAQREQTMQAVHKVLSCAPQPLTATAILLAFQHDSAFGALTKSHINGALYRLQSQRLVRQANAGQNPPTWEMVQQVIEVSVREVLRGRFRVPSILTTCLEDCPFPHMWDVQGEDKLLICKPQVADEVITWMRSREIEVQSLADRIIHLPHAPPPEIGHFFLQQLNDQWRVYDPVRLQWQYPPREITAWGMRAILREGWSLRQKRADSYLFYAAHPHGHEPLAGEDEAILRMLALPNIERVPIPAATRSGWLFLDMNEHWLPRSWFSWLAALRPSQKYPEKKLAFLETDRPLVEQALSLLGIGLGCWSDRAVFKHEEASRRTKLLCQLMCQVDAHLGNAQKEAREVLADNPDPEAAELERWLQSGLLETVPTEPVYGVVLGVAPIYRYRNRQLEIDGQRHWLYLPEHNRVVNFLSSMWRGDPGAVLRVMPSVFMPYAGLLRGNATRSSISCNWPPEELVTSFAKAHERLPQMDAKSYLGDLALPFPHTGYSCLIGVVHTTVVADLMNSRLRPALRLKDEEDTVCDAIVPWDWYADDQHPVHHIQVGSHARVIVALSLDSRFELHVLLVTVLEDC